MFVLTAILLVSTVYAANYQKRQTSFELFEFGDFVDNVQRPMIRLMEDISTEVRGIPYERNYYNNNYYNNNNNYNNNNGRYSQSDGPYRPTQEVNQQHAPNNWNLGDYQYGNQYEKTPVRSGYSRPNNFEPSDPRGPPAINEGPVTIERKILTPGYNPWEENNKKEEIKENNQFKEIGKDEGIVYTTTERIERTSPEDKTTTKGNMDNISDIEEFMERATGDDIEKEKTHEENTGIKNIQGVNSTEMERNNTTMLERNTTEIVKIHQDKKGEETTEGETIETTTSGVVNTTNETVMDEEDKNTEIGGSTTKAVKINHDENTQEANDGDNTTLKEITSEENKPNKNGTLNLSEKKEIQVGKSLRGPPIPQEVIKKLEELGLKIDKEVKQ